MICSSTTINHDTRSEFIARTFNKRHRKVFHVITLYRYYVIFFISTLEQLLYKIPLTYSIFILDDFNLDFHKEVDKYKNLQILHVYMSKYHLKQNLSISTTK